MNRVSGSISGRAAWAPARFTGACPVSTAIVTAVTPGRARSAASHSARICAATSAEAVVIERRNETFPPPTATSLTKPKETMSRLKPGYLTVRSASRTVSSLGAVGAWDTSVRVRRPGWVGRRGLAP